MLTLGLLSYLVADNPLYRILSHLFIGITAGYVALLAWYSVIEPQLVRPLLAAPPWAHLRLCHHQPVGCWAGCCCCSRAVNMAGRLGTLVVALMVGVGVAVAVGGGITGTLIPQVLATMVSVLPLEAGSRFAESWARGAVHGGGHPGHAGLLLLWRPGRAGQPGGAAGADPAGGGRGPGFIGVAFGVMYAGALAASVAIFAERSGAMWIFVTSLVK